MTPTRSARTDAPPPVATWGPAVALAASPTPAFGQGLALLDVALDAWRDQGRGLVDAMARDRQAALDGLKACRSPLDLIVVQQAWFAASASACLEAGVAMMLAGMNAPDAAATPRPSGFILPD